MTTLDNWPLDEESASTHQEENRVLRSWPEEHGGLIFLIIVASVVSLVVLYDSFVS